MNGARPLAPVTLVLGGARSGKSAHGEALIGASSKKPVYMATAEAGDGEMAERIARHQERRTEAWRTVEVPLDLTGALVSEAAPDTAVLVDCLTLWLSNLLQAGRDIEAEINSLADILPSLRGPVVFVSNEVGLGIVPGNAAARAFRDHAGRLHQAIAAQAQSVVLVVAGQPMMIKDV